MSGGAGGAKKISKKINIKIKIDIEIKIKDKGNGRWCRWCEED